MSVDKKASDWFYITPHAVLFHPEITLETLRIYSIIASMIRQNGEFFARNSYLSERLASHPRNIRKALNKLESIGIINRVTVDNKRYILISDEYKTAHKSTPNSPPKDPEPEYKTDKKLSTGGGGFRPPPRAVFAPPPSPTPYYINNTSLVREYNKHDLNHRDSDTKRIPASFFSFSFFYDFIENGGERIKAIELGKVINMKEAMLNNPLNLPYSLVARLLNHGVGNHVPFDKNRWYALNLELRDYVADGGDALSRLEYFLKSKAKVKNQVSSEKVTEDCLALRQLLKRI